MHIAPRNGVSASTFHLPPGAWETVLDCLSASFATIPRERWRDRMQRGCVLDADGCALLPAYPYRSQMRIYYFREVDDELPIPCVESIVHHDEHLLVADKPHFLPVMPSGGFVSETLLARLIRRTGNDDLVPLHRIDRATAGLVLFSCNRVSRARYQALFRDRQIDKLYEAIAPPMPNQIFPLAYASRLVRAEPFFRMRQIDGPSNAHTIIDVIDRGDVFWKYRLQPITGRKHQLRVQMAALGAPIRNDAWYPQLSDALVDDYSQPLQLLAKQLRFIDPLDGSARGFESPSSL